MVDGVHGHNEEENTSVQLFFNVHKCKGKIFKHFQHFIHGQYSAVTYVLCVY